MQVQINTDNNMAGGESLSKWMTQEITTRLNRFGDDLTRIEVHLADLDGSKQGNNDKRCRIEARLAGRQPVSVTDEADKFAQAFSGAVDKLLRMLDTDLGRLNDRHGRESIRKPE
ncbi:MAG: HPF/RaiA family ribosome-associated protein [Rhodoferax sp.]|uniref:HPF/RaiA family ribosome-associated protein n=1 Tax=Rhodoferax sp. TaxID=50421 RepID=UPI001B5368FE|nr:HPF/RaiA family ribosome-associated protein [Rhodoferax sp.]MBP9904555.1 HPF/RaiA family ribosome-associated protein [Rhodoferax sp.]